MYGNFPSENGHQEAHGHGGVHGLLCPLDDHLFALLQVSTRGKQSINQPINWVINEQTDEWGGSFPRKSNESLYTI